jgi:hypothetical protein
LSALAAVASIFTLLDVEVVRYASLGLFFAMWTAWSAWLLVLLWRRKRPFLELG